MLQAFEEPWTEGWPDALEVTPLVSVKHCELGGSHQAQLGKPLLVGGKARFESASQVQQLLQLPAH